MKFRLISLLTLALALPVVSGDESIQKLILLDRGGKRGLVTFDHKEHETKVNPDPQARLKAKEGGACAGCHHTRDEVGAPQLVKCKSCHVQEGDVANPKNQDGKELFVEEAYHDLCITCHRTAAKAPVLCTGCHKLGRSQRGGDGSADVPPAGYQRASNFFWPARRRCSEAMLEIIAEKTTICELVIR